MFSGFFAPFALCAVLDPQLSVENEFQNLCNRLGVINAKTWPLQQVLNALQDEFPMLFWPAASRELLLQSVVDLARAS